MLVSELCCKSRYTCSWIILTFIIFKLSLIVSQEVCNDTLDGCCIGYFRSSKNNTCEKCMLGYIGLNCSTQCPYPSYGEKCQNICDCSNETCNAFTGCEAFTASTTITMGVSLEASYSTTTTAPKANEMLLVFIQIIGCLDILILSAYLAVCIYDRTGQRKPADTVPPSFNIHQHSTMYEDIEDDLFTAPVVSLC